MNPFDEFNANFDQNRLNQYMQGRTAPQARLGGFQMGPQNAMAAGQPQAPQKKKKNFLIDQISTAGGILGGIGGGIAGGAAGLGIGAIPGAAVGGAAGSALGETLENLITGDSLGKNVGKEALLGGIFSAGPLRLAKVGLEARAGLSAAKAAGESLGVKAAIKAASDDVAKNFTLRGALGGKVADKATNLATKQFGLTDNFLGQYGHKFGEDAGKTITRYGASSVDDIGKAIESQQHIYDSLVGQANPIDKKTLYNQLVKKAEELLTRGPTPDKQMGEKLLAETDQLMSHFGDEKITPAAVNEMKKQYASWAKFSLKENKQADHTIFNEISDILRGSLQKASGSGQLKDVGRELQKLHYLETEAIKRAPAVASRASGTLGFRNIGGMVAGATMGGGGGFALGGPVGGIAGLVGTAALNSPGGRKVLAKGALKTGEALLSSGEKAAGKFMNPGRIALGVGIPDLLRSSGGLDNSQAMGGQDTSLEDFLAQSNMNQPTSAVTNPMTSASNSGSMSGQYNENTPQSSSPYSREALAYDIQRDPTNAEKYIDYYKELNSIFGGGSAGTLPKLNNTAIQSITDLQTGLDNLGGLQQDIQRSGANAPVLGSLRSMNPFDTEAKGLRAEIDRVKQVVGKALEGGVLRKEDEEKYARILPTISDTDAVAMEKINAIKTDLNNKLQSYYINQYQFGGGQPTSIEDALMQQQYGGNY